MASTAMRMAGGERGSGTLSGDYRRFAPANGEGGTANGGRRGQPRSPFALRLTPFASGRVSRPLSVDRLFALVVAAVGANPVGRLHLAAVRAFGERRRRERVVGPALVSAGAAVTSFGIGHR